MTTGMLGDHIVNIHEPSMPCHLRDISSTNCTPVYCMIDANNTIISGFYLLWETERALMELAVTANQNKSLIVLFSDVFAGPSRRLYSERHQSTFGFIRLTLRTRNS